MPASKPLTLSSSSALAVNMIIGMERVYSFCFNDLANLTPVPPGSIQSSKIKSGYGSLILACACSIVSASMALKPFCSKTKVIISLIAASSSTTKICLFMHPS